MNLRDFLFASKARTVTTLAALVVFLLSVFAGTMLIRSDEKYDFAFQQKISRLSQMRIGFPEPMDHASVEQFLILPKQVTASASWDGEIFVLTPSSELMVDQTYKIIVDGRALRKTGEPLGRDLVYTFIVTGAPKVAAFIPQDGTTGSSTTTEIAVVFDRPMISVADVHSKNSAQTLSRFPITIRPTLQGKWRWLGTTTLVFEPSKPLSTSTKYTVAVPSGISTLNGEKTEQAFEATFETERPRVVLVHPSEGSREIGPSGPLRIEFNVPIDLISIKEHTSMRLASGSASGQSFGFSKVEYGITEDASGKKSPNKSVVLLTPSQKLSMNSMYAVVVRAGVRGITGDLGTSEDYSWRFTTVGEFKLLQSRFPSSSLEIDFSNPIDGDTLKKYISFSPKIPDDTVSVWATYDHTGTANATVYGDFLPGTKYTATLSPAFKDSFGQSITSGSSVTFTTPDLLPDIFLFPRFENYAVFERSKPPVFYVNQVNATQELKFTFTPVDLSTLRDHLKYYANNGATMEMLQTSAHQKQWSYKPKSKKNEWQSISVDLEKELGKPLSPGIFALSVSSDTGSGSVMSDVRLFSLTNLGATIKYSGNSVLVWVTDLQTGEPVKNASVKLHALSKPKVVAGRTDDRGIFEAPISIADFQAYEYDYQPRFLVTVEKGDDFAFVGSDWNDGLRPYDFGDIYEDFRSNAAAQHRLLSYLSTDRPLYRAGDTVNFKGMLRFLDTKGVVSVPGSSRSVAVTIRDPEGTEVFKKTIKTNDFGSFHDAFTTSESASLGYYSIDASITPESDVEGSAYTSFSVLAYRKPEYSLSVDFEKDEYRRGDDLKARIEAKYYFGAPMAQAKLQWNAYRTPFTFSYSEGGWYSFSEDDAYCFYDCSGAEELASQGTGSFDAEGRSQVTLRSSADTAKSYLMTLEASVTDENDQGTYSRDSAAVHAADVYVGIGSEEYAVKAGSDATLKIITLTPEKAPAANASVRIDVKKRVWNTIRSKGVDGEYYYESSHEDTLITSLSTKTNGEGKASVPVRLDDGGEYWIVAKTSDSAGRETSAGWSLYAWEGEYYGWPRTNSDRMEIVIDKPLYQVGQTAHLIAKSPFQGKGVKALVTVEREGIMSTRIIDVENNAQSIDVPITDDMVPVSYVSVIVTKPRIGETFNEHGLDTGAPSFRAGYAKLQVDPGGKGMNVKVTTDKARYQPGEEVTATIETFSKDGNPMKAEVSLAVVDLSLLDLFGFQKPDIVSSFYYDRGLGVMTANMLTKLMERFKPGSKGGGGGEVESEGARDKFRDTAYWNPSIVTDQNGISTVRFKLPDNLTTWHLLAVAQTKDSHFGVAEHTIVETRNVIVRPVRPRFAVAGDSMVLKAIVHNYLTEKASFTVKLSGKGFTHNGAESQVISLEPDARMEVLFPVSVHSSKEMRLHFDATTGTASDSVEERIPIFMYGIDRSDATSGVTQTTITEAIHVPDKSEASSGELSVKVSPSVALYLTAALEGLATFPYGCAEQTMSSIIPNVALRKLQGYDAFQFVDDKTLSKNISAGLQKIYSFQKGDGGFGYWENPEATSEPYLSAYILHGLLLATEAGYYADQSAIQRTKAYVNSVLRVVDANRDVIDPTLRPYMLYVLAKAGIKDKPLLTAAYKSRAGLPLHARSHLAMALKEASMDSRAQEVLDEILSAARLEARTAHFEELEADRSPWAMNTDARTTALALQAILRIQPTHELVPKVVRGLLELRLGPGWDTTQSTAQAIFALTDYLAVTDELEFDFDYGVELANKKILEGNLRDKLAAPEALQSFADLPRGKELKLMFGKEGKGNLYYDAVLSYFATPERIDPVENGMGILRETRQISPSGKGMSVGSVHEVTLTMTVPETRTLVAVESLLPSGFEAIDTQYQTSKQFFSGASNSGYDDYYRNQMWRFSHIEYRDDRVFLFAEELPPGVYRYKYFVRATTAGNFRERPAKIWEMYHPETYGHTQGGWLKISQ